MSNPNIINAYNLDGRYTTPAQVNAQIAILTARLKMSPQVVKWTPGTGWGTYSTATDEIRYFDSTNDTAATAPTYYNSADKWFKYYEAP